MNSSFFAPAAASLLLLSACGGGEIEANNQAGVPIGDGLSVNALAANEAAVLPDEPTDNAALSDGVREGESPASAPATKAPAPRPEPASPPPPPKSTAERDEPVVKSAPKPPTPPSRQEDDPHAGHDMENEAE